jgi:phage tail sheath protein FI
MAEKIISPGVFTNEIDQTFLPAAVADIGAALVGPTLKGPAGVPTVVTSFSDFQAKFGDVFKNGDNGESVQFLTSHAAEEYLKNSDTLTVVRVMDGAFGPAEAKVTCSIATTDDQQSFTLETLADGAIMNNEDTTATTNNILVSGSKHNIRYEVSNVNNKKGTFTLLIRAGNDNIKRKQTLETFTGVNLDPNSNNFIAKVIGDQVQTIRTDENSNPFLQLTGSYPNKSRFVRVKSVNSLTTDYLDENGTIRINSASGSLPAAGSGSANGGFSGGSNGVSGFDALGNQVGSAAAGVYNFYENIATAGSQGLKPQTANEGLTGYTQALDLLKNQDEFDINLILLPGVINSIHSAVASKAIDVCESRGDCFTVIDPVIYGKNVTDATTEAEGKDSNFAAMYWPWVKVPDSQVAGTQRWVPPSTVIGGIYAFNDRVAHPWFAPAGLNRGGITTAIQAERKLTQSDRDSLYDSNVNPIATFPGQGVTVFGQKTLQKKSSALDRINVRRLLIRVKKFIASSSRFLVFEQNTAATRRRFLGIVNPFLENVQSQSGLSAFRVVMDETNNTPDTIDRNQLVGQLFLQPTRTAEFIVLDFTIQPTGASFPE